MELSPSDSRHVLLTDTLQTLDVSATQRPMELWELCRERSLAAHTLIEVARQIEEDSPEDLLPQASSLLSTVEERLTGTRPTRPASRPSWGRPDSPIICV